MDQILQDYYYSDEEDDIPPVNGGDFVAQMHHFFNDPTPLPIQPLPHSKCFFPFFTSTQTFESLGLKPDLVKGIKKIIDYPSDIQQRIVRAMSTGKDVIVEDSRGKIAISLDILHLTYFVTVLGTRVMGDTGKSFGIALSCLQAIDQSNPDCQVLWLADPSSHVTMFMKSVIKNMSDMNNPPPINLQMWHRPIKIRSPGVDIKVEEKPTYPLPPSGQIVVVSVDHLLDIFQFPVKDNQIHTPDKKIGKPDNQVEGISNEGFTSTTSPIMHEYQNIDYAESLSSSDDESEKQVTKEKDESSPVIGTEPTHVRSKPTFDLKSLKILVVEDITQDRVFIMDLMSHIEKLHRPQHDDHDDNTRTRQRSFSIIVSCSTLNSKVVIDCFKGLRMNIKSPINPKENGFIHTNTVNLMEPYLPPDRPDSFELLEPYVPQPVITFLPSGLSSVMTFQCILSTRCHIPSELRLVIQTYHSRLLNDHNIQAAVNLWCEKSVNNTTLDRVSEEPNTVYNEPDENRKLAKMLYGSHISHWETCYVTNMEKLFMNKFDFNDNINYWDTSNVIDMSQMFSHATSFNQPLNRWNVGQVESMVGMFACASSFNQPIEDWDVSSVAAMKGIFYEAISFNQPLAKWDMGSVVWIMDAFSHAWSFNQPLESWQLHNVNSLAGMFHYICDTIQSTIIYLEYWSRPWCLLCDN